MDVNEDNEMAIEAPPHLETEAAAPVVKKIVLNDDENDFDSMNIRPEALFLRGVDDLAPRDIKLYVDRYVRPDYSFANKAKFEAANYKLEWINDTSLNLVFNDAGSAKHALEALSAIPVTDIADTEERATKSYTDVEKNPEADISSDPQLYIRQSFSYDRKIKNAREYSRYYLLHGEPEKAERPRRDYYSSFKSDRYRQRDDRRSYRDDEPDLLTGEIKRPQQEVASKGSLQDRIGFSGSRSRGRRNRDDEDDLFPDLLAKQKERRRSMSPTRDQSMDLD